MTFQTLATIILWIIGIILTIGVILASYIYGRLSIKNNPDKAFIFVRAGLNINKPIKADLAESTGSSKSFNYGDKVIIVPRSYDEVYYRNRRAIFVSRSGQLIASPFDKDIKVKDDLLENLVYEICASHVGSDGMKALRGKGGFKLSMVIILIVVVIGAVAVFGYNQYKQGNIDTPIQQEAKEEQQIKITPVEEK